MEAFKMTILSNLNITRMLRFLLASIIVISIVFIYSSYPLSMSLMPQLQAIRRAAKPVLRNGSELAVAPMPRMIKLNNTGEFRLGVWSDDAAAHRVPRQHVGGFPQEQLEPEHDNVTDINFTQHSVENLVDGNQTLPKVEKPTPEKVKFISFRCEEKYERGHLNEEIDMERICPLRGEKIQLLILIASKRTHADERLAIRQTWGHFGTRRDIAMAFVLGRGHNESVDQALTQENSMYGDLIRGSFIDSYYNLTLKTISMLEWTDRHCDRAKYVLKTDDDMFINVPRLMKFLGDRDKKRTIYGRLAKRWTAVRNVKSKYYVSHEEYPKTFYPPFTTGPAYILTGDVVHELYVRALNMSYLKLEDVFITGLVAIKLGIERVHVNDFLNRRVKFGSCIIRKAISVHMINTKEQFDLWRMLQGQTRCTYV
ncbi:hypothetical protein KR222_000203 [Zaprionus bogoriensis]|nr:hypothetical protein KR222_000203 [Zaprionus bogoriensis]